MRPKPSAVRQLPWWLAWTMALMMCLGQAVVAQSDEDDGVPPVRPPGQNQTAGQGPRRGNAGQRAQRVPRRPRRRPQNRPTYQPRRRMPWRAPIVYNPTHTVGVPPPDDPLPVKSAGTIVANGHVYDVPRSSP